MVISKFSLVTSWGNPRHNFSFEIRDGDKMKNLLPRSKSFPSDELLEYRLRNKTIVPLLHYWIQPFCTLNARETRSCAEMQQRLLNLHSETYDFHCTSGIQRKLVRTDRIRERFIEVHKRRSALQNNPERNWMKVFTLTLNFVLKVLAEGVIAPKLCAACLRSKEFHSGLL